MIGQATEIRPARAAARAGPKFPASWRKFENKVELEGSESWEPIGWSAPGGERNTSPPGRRGGRASGQPPSPCFHGRRPARSRDQGNRRPEHPPRGGSSGSPASLPFSMVMANSSNGRSAVSRTSVAPITSVAPASSGPPPARRHAPLQGARTVSPGASTGQNFFSRPTVKMPRRCSEEKFISAIKDPSFAVTGVEKRVLPKST